MNGGPWGVIGAGGLLVWFLRCAWYIVTGPQNIPGWIFFLSLPLTGLLIGRLVGGHLEKKARRART